MAQKSRILVVDDQRDLVELIGISLRKNGYEVAQAFDGKTALDMARRTLPDLVVLDLMMPGLSGQEVATALKAEPQTAGIPVVMLTAKADESDILVGLAVGADDYVTKPFSMKVLVARIGAILRRKAAPDPSQAVLTVGPVVIDQSRHEASVEGKPISLTPTEFKLLAALVAARGRVLSRDQLMNRAMGSGIMVTDRAIDVHVTSVRKKMGDYFWMVHTVRGVGYRIVSQREEDA